jgi:DNA repair exonuclease SbcCD ATPase subunit
MHLEPVDKKSSYTELYAAEARFQQLKKQYQNAMANCSPDKPCVEAAHLNAELQNQLGIIANQLDQLNPKQSATKRDKLIQNLSELDKQYDELLRTMDESKTYEERNTDLNILANMHYGNILPWSIGSMLVILLLIQTAI